MPRCLVTRKNTNRTERRKQTWDTIYLGDTVKFTTIMGPPTGGSWWWYWGLSGEEVGARLSQNKAQLTDISPYIAPDGTLRFAVIMVGQTGKAWWWYWGQTGDQGEHSIPGENRVQGRYPSSG
jgi:hypothetical protein